MLEAKRLLLAWHRGRVFGAGHGRIETSAANAAGRDTEGEAVENKNMKPKKPKPRVVYLIENKANPAQLLQFVRRTRKDAEEFRNVSSMCGRVRKFVEVCDE